MCSDEPKSYGGVRVATGRVCLTEQVEGEEPDYTKVCAMGHQPNHITKLDGSFEDGLNRANV